MDWQGPTDPNAYLGHASPFSTVLIVGTLLVLGLSVNLVATHLLKLRTQIGIIVFLVYAMLSLVIAGFLGPFSLSADGPVYDAQAVSFAARLGLLPTPSQLVPLDSGKWGWPMMLAVIYAFDGRVPLAGMVVNAMFMGLTALFIAKAAQAISGSWRRYTLLSAFLLFPPFWFMGPSLMREPACWMGISLVVLAVSLWYTRRRPLVAMLLVVFSITFLLWVRFPLGLLVLLGLGVGFGLIQLLKIAGRLGVVVGVGIALGAVLVIGDFILVVFGYDLAYILQTRTYLAETASTGFGVSPVFVDAFGPTGAMIATVPKTILGPLPWEVGADLVWAWVGLNTLVWWLGMVLAYRALRKMQRFDIGVILVGMALTLLIGMGVTLTNYGIVVRMRAIPFIILLVIIAGLKNLPTASEGPDLGRRTKV